MRRKKVVKIKGQKARRTELQQDFFTLIFVEKNLTFSCCKLTDCAVDDLWPPLSIAR